MVLYDLIKRDIVPYMEIKYHEITCKRQINLYHRNMEKLENSIKHYEQHIDTCRKTIADYAEKCIKLQLPPITTKFD
jgi:hypothetical protein